jgi:hypothetical protein
MAAMAWRKFDQTEHLPASQSQGQACFTLPSPERLEGGPNRLTSVAANIQPQHHRADSDA